MGSDVGIVDEGIGPWVEVRGITDPDGLIIVLEFS